GRLRTRHYARAPCDVSHPNSKAEPFTLMTNLKEHFSARGSASSLLTSRFSKHPERYLEIFRVLRKYKLHHVVAELGMSHSHGDEDAELRELPSANGHVED